jgi:hypothetical protein
MNAAGASLLPLQGGVWVGDGVGAKNFIRFADDKPHPHPGLPLKGRESTFMRLP